VLCDGLDDDGDGEVDEDFSWQGIAVADGCPGVGICGEGVVECTSDHKGAVCSTLPGGSATPAGDEICDGLDNDCDGITPPEEVDGDDDSVLLCAGDCDDSDAEVFPDAGELCDGKDNDCNGKTDEGFSLATDSQNCGECGQVCNLEDLHATAVCQDSKCLLQECEAGWFDGDGEYENG